MNKLFSISVVSGIAIVGLFFALSSVHAQEFDYGGFGGFDSFGDFGGWGDGNYGFDSFGSFGGGYEDAYNPCGSDGCGGGINYGAYNGYSGCGYSCFGGLSGYAYQPFVPFYGGGLYQTPSQSSSSVYAPTTIDDHSVVTTNITTTAPPAYTPSYSYPVSIPYSVYTAPPVYYPPPIYTPPPVYQPPIVCSVQLTNFNPPGTAIPWQLYSYRVTAHSTIGGQISYRLVSAPDGMGINSATGQMTWTPGTNQTRGAAYQVTVAAYNGSCETTQTFYVTVPSRPTVTHVPPPVIIAYGAPKPKPAPVCCQCVCPPAEEPADPTVCPPTKNMPTTDTGNDVVNTSTVLTSAASGFWSGIKTLFASPFTLFIVIAILAILLVRAHRRIQKAQITI